MSFIKHVPPFSDESALGYIQRLATNNYLSGWKEVASILNVSASRSALINSCDELYKRFDFPCEWVELIKSNENQCHLWNRFHQSYHVKLCPLCIREDAYKKNKWEHVFYTTCAKHKCDLIEECPSCHTPLKNSLINFTSCKCGFDLRNTQVLESPKHLHVISQMLEGYIDAEDYGLPFVNDIDANKASNLIRILCQQFDSKLPWQKSASAPPQNLIMAKRFLSPMEEIFKQWPSNLENHVSDRMAISSGDGYTPAKILGNWYRGIKDLTLGNSLEFFLKAILNKVSDLSGKTTSFDGASFLIENPEGYLSVNVASKKYSINRLTIIKAINCGAIGYRKIGKGKKSFTYEVLENDLKQLTEKRAQWCNSKEAYEYLGISQYLFDQIVVAKLVDYDKEWKANIYKAGPVAIASLESIINNNKKRIEHEFHDKHIEIKNIASLKLGENSKIHHIFQGILNGEIRVLSTIGKFGEHRISLSDVYDVLQVSIQGKGYSIEELGSITGWKWEAIGHWMDCGLLEFDIYQIKGRECRFVTPNQLINFQRKYIPTVDLMRQIGRTTRYLKNHLPQLSIVGEKALPNGNFLGGLVSLSEWMKLSLEIKATAQ